MSCSLAPKKGLGGSGINQLCLPASLRKTFKISPARCRVKLLVIHFCVARRQPLPGAAPGCFILKPSSCSALACRLVAGLLSPRACIACMRLAVIRSVVPRCCALAMRLATGLVGPTSTAYSLGLMRRVLPTPRNILRAVRRLRGVQGVPSMSVWLRNLARVWVRTVRPIFTSKRRRLRGGMASALAAVTACCAPLTLWCICIVGIVVAACIAAGCIV